MRNSKKSTEELLEETNKKLDIIIAVLLIRDKPKQEQIKILTNYNLNSSEIGRIVGLDSSRIRQLRLETKKRSKSKK